ncbi:MAG: hypothetical protein IPK19_14825 [Chloroflexi bacterium]|nr:hypothetical protein [Chloroflexota bacterium]
MNDPDHVHDSINLLAGGKVSHTTRPGEASKTMEFALQGRTTGRNAGGRRLSAVWRGFTSLFRRSST